jgi:aspartyl-tRNA synthetase
MIRDVTGAFRGRASACSRRSSRAAAWSRDPGARRGGKSRKFFDDMNDWARSEGHAGPGLCSARAASSAGPIAKNHGEERMPR